MRPDAFRFARPWRIRICRLLVVACALVLPVSDIRAQADTRARAEIRAQAPTPIRFAIDAQPLAAALDAYGAASGRDLYYDGALVVGRQSSAIEGWLAPDDALRGLLAGSGLVARTIGPNAVTVAPPAAPRAASALQLSYFATVQARVAQVLCARPEARPGASDILIQIWIAPSGTVQRARILDAGGRDLSAFAAALHRHSHDYVAAN